MNKIKTLRVEAGRRSDNISKESRLDLTDHKIAKALLCCTMSNSAEYTKTNDMLRIMGEGREDTPRKKPVLRRKGQRFDKPHKAW